MFNIEQVEKSFNQNVRDISKLRSDLEAIAGRPVECQPIFRKFFLNNLLMSFNLDPTMVTDEMLCEVGELMEKGLGLVKIRFMKPWTRNSIYWKLFGYQRQLDHIHERFKFYMTQAFKYYENRLKSAESEFEDPKAVRIITGILVGTADPQWKHDQTVTFIGAGTDTTAITATMTLFFLALNPECQKKAQDEVDLLFKETFDGELLFTDLPKLKYLRMCIKEAMRLHAPAAVIGRNTTEEILMADGRKIPKDTGVLIVIPEMHMNPDNFPNPEKFDPERFNESNVYSIKPYTYMPFSAGPRSCIGQKYAESVLAPVLAYILRDFSVQTNQKAADIKSLYEIAGQPYPNVALTFDKRC